MAAHFDFDDKSRSVPGTHLEGTARRPAQAIVGLFSAYIEHDFLNQIETYRDLSFQYLKQITTAPGCAQVNTRVRQRGKERFTMNFALKQENPAWKVTDIAINGLSMIAGNRTQFSLIIDDVGIDALMSDLQNKRAEPEAFGEVAAYEGTETLGIPPRSKMVIFAIGPLGYPQDNKSQATSASELFFSANKSSIRQASIPAGGCRPD